MSKNLVICPVGIQSTHRLWNIGERDFDTVLICYNKDAYKTYKNDAGEVFYKEGYKYTLIKEYLEENGLQHENYLFIDDDTGINNLEINEIFKFMSRNKIPVLHPAVVPFNQPNTLIHPNNDCEYRFTNWTEIQCLFMSKEYLSEVIEYFDVNTSGWGLPELMFNKTKTPYLIYDTIPILHIRHTNSGVNPLYDMETAYNELNEVLQTTEFYEKKVLQYKPKNIISFPIIFNKEKAHYLPDLLDSLPENSEIILMETIPIADEDKGEGIFNVRRSGNIVTAQYYYKLFNYAKARNACKSLATRPILFSIDSDERLLKHQNTELIQTAINLNKSEHGALQVRNFGTVTEYEENGKFLASLTEQVRIFKNLPEIKWDCTVHEVLDKSLLAAGLTYTDSNIFIHHVGYQIDKKSMLDKARNRIEMLIRDGDAFNDNFYYDYLKKEVNNFEYWRDNLKKEK